VTFGLGSAPEGVQQGASECNEPDSAADARVQSAMGCTIGADLGDRGKDRGKFVIVPAVRVMDAITMLDRGDAEGARSALMSLVRRWR